VFSAGIGENDPAIREIICNRLTWWGVYIDSDANTQNAPLISHPNSRIIVRVIPTDEERMIALHVIEALGASNTSAERQTSENCA
jgi:acetate kinase